MCQPPRHAVRVASDGAMTVPRAKLLYLHARGGHMPTSREDAFQRGRRVSWVVYASSPRMGERQAGRSAHAGVQYCSVCVCVRVFTNITPSWSRRQPRACKTAWVWIIYLRYGLRLSCHRCACVCVRNSMTAERSPNFAMACGCAWLNRWSTWDATSGGRLEARKRGRSAFIRASVLGVARTSRADAECNRGRKVRHMGMAGLA